MSILLTPELRRGRGTGHLRRALRLLDQLDDCQILIPDPPGAEFYGRSELSDLLEGVPEEKMVGRIDAGRWEKIVIDRFDLSEREAVDLTSVAMTIGVDLGGPGRAYCSYCIDTLPRLESLQANRSDPGFLALPSPAQLRPEDRGRILVTFGGEDPAGLTESVSRALAGLRFVDRERITVVQPSLRPPQTVPEGVTVIGPVRDLSSLLAGHEWVVTAFGLTVFEAAATGRKVITVAPGRYHHQLARAAGLPTCGIGAPDSRRLGSALQDPIRAESAGAALRPVAQRSLSAEVSDLEVPPRRGSPALRGAYGRAIWRNAQKTYFTCPDTGVIYLERYGGGREEYRTSYFMEEYQAQYGKTYLEDFDHIRAMGLRRAETIRAVMGGTGTLLDIGCAYGPFMDAARDVGFTPFGVDVAGDAVSYVRRELHLPACVASVLEFDPGAEFGEDRFDVITMWYVVEHFWALDELLERVRGWLSPGGVLAISTPNSAGVSGRREPDRFFRESPRDHFTVWAPETSKRLLARYGFRVRRIDVTGHHPERYPSAKKGLVPRSLAALHSSVFGWGDTFEVYARREGR